MLQPMRVLPRQCDWCGAPFYQGRADHRFCSVTCGQLWHCDERRQAIAAWRARQGEEEQRDDR
jgi:hypothetical protein